METMVSTMSLLWPVLLSTVIVFIASSIIHMASPWHRSDYPGLPDEEAFRKTFGALKVPPGDYFVPRPQGRAAMREPDFKAKVNDGPRVIMTVLPNGWPSMAKPLIGWFIYSLVVNYIAGHVAQAALAPGATYRIVFHTVGLTAFAGYALGLWQQHIWFGRSLSVTVKSTVDGLIYASLVAGTFGWLWPR